MADATNGEGASKWDFLSILAKRIEPDWLPRVLLLAIFAYVFVRALPHICKAVIEDRKDKRRHQERMTQLQRKLETRRETRQKRKVGKSPESERSTK